MAARTRTQYENAVALAGDRGHLPAGTRWHFPRVESRFLFWCGQGRGVTWIDGREHALEPGRFFILPWGTDHCYEAVTAMTVSGVHVAPWYDPHSPLIRQISHSPDSAMAGHPSRRDLPCPGLEKVVSGMMSEHPVLALQAEYVVGWFLSGAEPDPFVARALGPLILRQWMHTARTEEIPSFPPELLAVLNFLQSTTVLNPCLDEMTAVSGVSKSTVIRLFRHYLRRTPHQWLSDRQQHTAEYLLRSTGMRVKEIAEFCGIRDPFQFSRWFRSRAGMSPREFRRRHTLAPRLPAHGRTEKVRESARGRETPKR